MTRADRERQVDELAAQLIAAGAVQSDPRYALTDEQRRYAIEQAHAHLHDGEPLSRVVALALIDAEAELSREYSDNVQFASQAAIVYEHVTGGLLSKPTYEASEVIRVHDDRCHESCEKDQEDLEDACEDLVEAARQVLRYFDDQGGAAALGAAVDALRVAMNRLPA